MNERSYTQLSLGSIYEDVCACVLVCMNAKADKNSSTRMYGMAQLCLTHTNTN